jgi:glycosyltransferase involved in cell wall biosynthesis
LKIYVIIAAYNEAPTIGGVLDALQSLGYSAILVDDGSSDKTMHIASSFPVTIIRHPINLGQGASLETGMEAARFMNADYIVHFDGDGQHDERDIALLLKPLMERQCDIVFGSRFLGTPQPGLSMPKRLTLRAGRWINYLLTGILLTDAHNGLRAMNRKALNKIHFTQEGMAHATEILYCVKKNSLKYLEVPVHIRYTSYSKRKGQTIMNAVNILFHLLYKKN